MLLTEYWEILNRFRWIEKEAREWLIILEVVVNLETLK
jgi:hypothetical protein